MKKIILLVAFCSISFLNAQVFIGSGDNKFQVGANVQDNGSGLNLSYDFGVGPNMSFGVSSTYLLGVDDSLNADFGDRFDMKGRFNAHLGNVVKMDENFDIYPGLNFSLKNFGGHLGMRYFFSDGFGLFTEFNIPIAKYNTDTLTPAEKLHNQFTFNFGASFSL
jgi:hypothetical protein